MFVKLTDSTSGVEVRIGLLSIAWYQPRDDGGARLYVHQNGSAPFAILDVAESADQVDQLVAEGIV